MTEFWQTVFGTLKMMLPAMATITLIWPIPFIVAEQLRPAVRRPGWRDYAMNWVIALSTLVLAAPLGVLADMAAAKLQAALGWQPYAIPFDALAGVPMVGPALKFGFLMVVPLLLHDLWFYWSHRLEHKFAPLWAFHSLHHSDPTMNCTTWARDHFIQSVWRGFLPAFTLGLLVKLSYREAGQAAMLGMMGFMVLSMFYHSAIRVELPWLDKILVTPQVHRIHHSRDPAHFNRNFADLFPLFDILFGTYEKPQRGCFADTGLEDGTLTPRNPLGAQLTPVLRALKLR